MKIVIDDKIPFIKGVFEPMAEVVYAPGAKTTKELVRDADAIITRTRTRCNEELLAGSKVKVIATATIGYDHIDTAYCKSNNIHWENAPGCNAYAVVQYVFSALANLYDDEGLKNKTLGIVGVGNVGSRIAAFAQKLGMKVLLNDPPRADKEGQEGFVSIEEIQSKSDIITFHTPLTRDGKYPTYHLCDLSFLRKLQKTPLLINAARGEIIKGADLVQNSDKYSDVVIDCWENEPEINLDLLKIASIGTFHIAGYSLEGKANATTAAVRIVSRALRLGIDQWQVDLDPLSETSYPSLLADVKSSYDIMSDDRALRQSPDSFEKLRGNYSYRRETKAIY